jgi:hypothetical protein
MPPRWLAEGLAMLFEAPGVYDSQNYRQQTDRINRGRLLGFQRACLPNHRPEFLMNMVASDEMCATNPGAFYAEAWAFTFFLMENEPTKYGAYLKLTAARAPFTEYSSSARMNDFTSVFGSDWKMLHARFVRFMGELR